MSNHTLKIIYPVSEDEIDTAHWIRETRLDGMKCILKDDCYVFDIGDGNIIGPSVHIDNINASWITEIKEPLTVDEWIDTNKHGTIIVSGHNMWTDSDIIKSWNAALENQKLGHVVDEEKDHKARLDYLSSCPLLPCNREIWNEALKYARRTP